MITLRMSQGIKRAINKVNAKEYVMEGFLEPGLVSYADVDGGVCRLDKEVIDAMLPSFVGCPVTIDHVEESKDEILNGHDQAVKEKKRGSVTKAWWNADTGRYDCSFTVEGQDAAEAVLNGYSGSCAYNVTETGPGGELHAMKYNETILGGEFEHLALVTNPRYEDCRIKLNGKVRMNSKAGEIKDNGVKCSICKKPISTGERNPDIDYCDGHAQSEWDEMKKNGSPDFEAEFAKEQKEHPELPAEEIKKIVLDHAREKNKAMDGDKFFDSKENTITLKNANPTQMAEGILQDINPAQITETACVNWALDNGYTKSEGQQAWKIIFREMREMNGKVTLKNAETINLRVQRTSENIWSVVGVHAKNGGNGAGAIMFKTRDEAIEKGRSLEKETSGEPRPYRLMSIENSNNQITLKSV